MSEEYKFVTKEEFSDDTLNAQGYVDQMQTLRDLVGKLLKERDAFREVAINDAYDPWSHGEKLFERGPAEREVDAEARRLLSPSGAKREKEGGV